MAYIDQTKKAVIAAALKVAMKPYPLVKYTLSIQNRSSITCTIKQGPKCLDIDGKGRVGVNPYYIERSFNEEATEILTKIKDCLNLENHDNSDVQSDYFDVGHYIHIEIGRWDKPFVAV